MKKELSRVIAMLMAIVIAFSMLPMTEAKASENDVNEETIVELEIILETFEEGKGWKNLYETIAVNENASIEEIIEVLPAADDLDSCKFTGWEFVGRLEGQIPTFRATYEKTIVDLELCYLNEDLEMMYDTESVFLEEGATYHDVLESLKTPENVHGCNFLEWNLDMDDVSLDDTIDSSWLIWNAVYDQYPAYLNYIYIDSTGVVKETEIIEFYDAGTSITSIYEKNKVAPADASSDTIEWFETEITEEAISLENNKFDYRAKYEDKVMVEWCYDYIEDAETFGKSIYNSEYIVIDIETCKSFDLLQSYFQEKILPEMNISHFNDISFDGWRYDYSLDIDEEYINEMYVEAEYDTENVILLKGYVPKTEYTYVWVTEAGKKVTLPYVQDGYYLTWYDANGEVVKDDVYMIPADAKNGEQYWLEAKRDGEIFLNNDANVSIVDKNKVLPEWISITCSRITNGSLYESTLQLLDSKYTNVLDKAFYEINIQDKDGMYIHLLKEPVEMYIELPFEVEDANELLAVRIDEAKEEFVKCDVILSEENYCIISTYHFSTYVFIKQEVENENQQVDEGEPESENQQVDEGEPESENQQVDEGEPDVESQLASEGNQDVDNQPEKAPKTGDTTVVLYIMLLLFGTGMLILGRRKYTSFS